MAEGFIFFAAVLLQGFLCARLLPHKYNYMEKGILAGVIFPILLLLGIILCKKVKGIVK